MQSMGTIYLIYIFKKTSLAVLWGVDSTGWGKIGSYCNSSGERCNIKSPEARTECDIYFWHSINLRTCPGRNDLQRTYNSDGHIVSA
jgi:hypothetical protein